MKENFALALPDAAECRATSSDMVKRELLFEHCLTLHRSGKVMELVGPAALPATVDGHGMLGPLAFALLTCLSNLWCCIRAHGKVRFVYVADRAGSSNGVNVAHYMQLAKAASLLLERDIGIEVIGRRLPTEAGFALTDTQLARSVVKSSAKEVFWDKDKRYRVEKLVAFFVSLKPHAVDIRRLMERCRA